MEISELRTKNILKINLLADELRELGQYKAAAAVRISLAKLLGWNLELEASLGDLEIPKG